jgi:ribose 5-phosphate isomerase B
VKIAIGNDHAALDMKRELKVYLEQLGHEVTDYGTHTAERVSYPEFGAKVARAVVSGAAERGILICGSGVGIGIAANKVRGIRCCTCSEPSSAKLSREHNNSNVLAFGARVVGIELAKMIVEEWLAAQFEGGRHQERLDMIAQLELEQ